MSEARDLRISSWPGRGESGGAAAMRSGSIRRRDVAKKRQHQQHQQEEMEESVVAAAHRHGSEATCEPLGIFYCPWQTSVIDDDDDEWRERRRREEQAWTQIFSKIIVQWGHWFSHIVAGSGAWVGSVLHRVVTRRHDNGAKIADYDLTPIQEERLHKLQQRLEVPFDGTRSEHQEALMSLWRFAFPGCELRSLVTEKWKEMGWQGSDPSTDFRGGGFVSLENLLFLAEKYPKSFHRLLHKEGGKRAVWEYPFAVAGINVSFMLIQMLDLRSAKPSSTSGLNFLKLLAEDETAFDILYCIAFEMMDYEWLAMHATYMEFNAVLTITRQRLERELSLKEVTYVKDLPAYTLLCQ
ncbi:ELMO domain-containing protein A-like [Selaginella moellendorffii]|uniref:ELMO domain-containing protein A-like n=1 Tax=Selaginella moellendorffii TaxID=88036 RepID=UPI000D1C9B71|nr:ELMO domain-containing protein A-like [Selaginella moellendorffii]|eukprot:XP_024528589.1 ELMO domain-containing protein A-like [Selaginella moellendorffii]